VAGGEILEKSSTIAIEFLTASFKSLGKSVVILNY
jgi:hypothetical protein